MSSVLERYHFKPFVVSSHSWALKICDQIPSTSSILDVGPGSCSFGQFFKDRGFDKLYAIENDAENRERAKLVYGTVVAELTELKQERFELILLLDVLEHMPNPFDFFAQVSKLLKPGGMILISLPNIAHWSVRIPLLFGYFNYQDRGLLDRTHLQFFTRARFRELLQSVPDLRLIEESSSIEPAELILPKAIWNNELWRRLSLIRLSLARYLSGFFAFQHLGAVKKIQ